MNDTDLKFKEEKANFENSYLGVLSNMNQILGLIIESIYDLKKNNLQTQLQISK